MFGELGLIQSAPTSPRRAELFIERDGFNYAGRFAETRSGTTASERGTRSTSTRTSTPGIPWNAPSLGGSRSKVTPFKEKYFMFGYFFVKLIE